MTDLAARRAAEGGCAVEIIRWPADARLRDTLARVGVPRMLLVQPGVEPPFDLGLDEDWIRLPANDDDVRLKALRLSHVAAQLGHDGPFIDQHRIFHRAGATVLLSSAEAAILQLLLDRRGTIVTFEDLRREVWSGVAQSHDAVDAAIYRLRRRLSGLNVVIRSVRNRGFIIDRDRDDIHRDGSG